MLFRHILPFYYLAFLLLILRMLQVDIRNLRYFYVEDDGGSPVVTPVQSELRAAQQKVVKHLEKAYGIKAKKVKLTGSGFLEGTVAYEWL